MVYAHKAKAFGAERFRLACTPAWLTVSCARTSPMPACARVGVAWYVSDLHVVQNVFSMAFTCRTLLHFCYLHWNNDGSPWGGVWGQRSQRLMRSRDGWGRCPGHALVILLWQFITCERWLTLPDGFMLEDGFFFLNDFSSFRSPVYDLSPKHLCFIYSYIVLCLEVSLVLLWVDHQQRGQLLHDAQDCANYCMLPFSVKNTHEQSRFPKSILNDSNSHQRHKG